MEDMGEQVINAIMPIFLKGSFLSKYLLISEDTNIKPGASTQATFAAILHAISSFEG